MKPAQLVILDKVDERLNLISIINEFSFTANKIKRASLKPFKAGDLPAVNYWSGVDTLVGKDNGMETRELPLTIEAHDKTRDEPFTDVAYKLGADLITAIFRDISAPKISDQASLSLGGLVSSVVVNSITPTISEGQNPWCGVVVDLTVTYNIKVSDVFNIINF